ncbi:hypothetical protein V8E55_001996 [Tylopilus felleus]
MPGSNSWSVLLSCVFPGLLSPDTRDVVSCLNLLCRHNHFFEILRRLGHLFRFPQTALRRLFLGQLVFPATPMNVRVRGLDIVTAVPLRPRVYRGSVIDLTHIRNACVDSAKKGEGSTVSRRTPAIRLRMADIYHE